MARKLLPFDRFIMWAMHATITFFEESRAQKATHCPYTFDCTVIQQVSVLGVGEV